MGGTARAVGNLYDLNGNRIRVTHPDGTFFTYELDGLDQRAPKGGRSRLAKIESAGFDNAMGCESASEPSD